jgi:hypothetical protein
MGWVKIAMARECIPAEEEEASTHVDAIDHYTQ